MVPSRARNVIHRSRRVVAIEELNMRQNVKIKKAAKPAQGSDAGRKLWLASLGAMSLAQKQGEKAIDALVAEGTAFQNRARKLRKNINNDARKFASGVEKRVTGLVNPIRSRAIKNVQEVESAVTERIGSVLGRFGVPSKGDVQELLTRVSELNREVKAGVRKSARA